MAEDPSTSGDKQRIEVLEEEVARLRSKLGDLPPDEDDKAAERVALPNKTRAIIVAALAGALALGLVVALVSGMSQCITPASKKAAKALSPFEPEGQPDPGARPKAKPQPPPADVPRAPGL